MQESFLASADRSHAPRFMQTPGGLGPRKQPVCYCTKKAAIIFSGYLSNLSELVEELQYRSASKLASSYDSDGVTLEFTGSGAQGLLAAQTVLAMFLESPDSDNLPMLLSELQARSLSLACPYNCAITKHEPEGLIPFPGPQNLALAMASIREFQKSCHPHHLLLSTLTASQDYHLFMSQCKVQSRPLYFSRRLP